MTNEEAIKWFRVSPVYHKDHEPFKMAIKALEKTKWTPISERLPEKGKSVLVCYETQGGIAQAVSEWVEVSNRGIIWSALYGNEPVAWMSLPEPYKAESEDKK